MELEKLTTMRNHEQSTEKYKYPKWQIQDDQEGMDTVTEECRFSGRLTKARYKALSRYCRANSWRSHCHHDYDCCGCVFMVSMSFTYQHNQVIIYRTTHRNY